MIKNASISARYARALQILTEKQVAKARQGLIPVLERTLEELQGLAGIASPDTRLGKFLYDPQVSPADRRKVLDQGLQGKVLPSVRVFADLLLRKKRFHMIASVAHEFQAIVERTKGLERASVVSAVPLTSAEQKRLHAELERHTGKKIVLDVQVDASLVGGAYVRIGDRVIDRSVKTLLEAISNQLYEVSV